SSTLSSLLFLEPQLQETLFVFPSPAPFHPPINGWILLSTKPKGVIRNGLLMLFLIFYVKRKPFTVYILHLVIADFMVLCTSILQLIILLCDRLNDDTLLKYIIFLILFGYNTGLHLLTVISVERCLSAYPSWYQCQLPKHQSAVACTLLWALSLLVFGLENFFCIQVDEFRFPKRPYVYKFLGILAFLVFVPLMIFTSLRLLIQVCCNLKPRQPAKLYIIIIATVVLFLVFAVPIKVLRIINNLVWKLYPYLNVLSTINCSVDPIVYFVVGRIRRKKSRKSLREALQKVLEEKPVAGLGENVAQPSSPSTAF
uniref:G-protein coupled receptors family 1 profile domain-containing protein n=1 Tax=Chlorocebus sabaeus TaxID=60711 RepID=A0A0D9RJ30_CHLSB